MSREGVSRDRARDHIIMEGLKRGDCSALAAMLMDGHVPAPNVRLVMALMLLDNDQAEAAVAAHRVDPDLWWMPHRLVVKPRPAKPRRAQGPEQVGKRVPLGSSGPLMPDVGYQAAIARVDEAVRAADGGGRKASAAKPVAAKPTRRGGSKAKK